MDSYDAALEAWEQRLLRAEDELRERERQALAHGPTPGELLAFAAEHDKLLIDLDRVASSYDEGAADRDRAGLDRDVVGSVRDRTARATDQDRDPAFADRSHAGTDRDSAAGDRSDSHDDRVRSRLARERAADDRARSADDRERAGAQAAEQVRQLDGLHAALESRTIIGQAQGLLMARHDLTAQNAFAVLVRLSQQSNTKLRDVAARLVADADPSCEQVAPARTADSAL